MKSALAILLLIIPLFGNSQKRNKFWEKQASVFIIGFIGGVADGQNEIILHNPYLYSQRHPNANPQWWNPKISNNNKDDRPWIGRTLFVATSDKYHLNKFIQNITWVGQIGFSFTLWEKPNWKQILVQSAVMWGSRSLGKGLTHRYYKNF